MNYLKTSLTCMVVCLMLAVIPKVSFGQSQTPTLESINLPFNIDGYVERQNASYGDWTKGSQTNGIDSGSVFLDNGNVRNIPLTYHVLDVYSGSDEIFATGAKYGDDPSTWAWKYGSPQSKSDINNINIHFSNDASNGDLWTVIAGDREATTGTAYLDFEFLQNEVNSVAPIGGGNGSFTTEGPDCGRTEGDLLVTVEYSGGGSVDSLYFYKWAAKAASACGFGWESFTIAGTDAFGYANNSTIAVPYQGFGSSTYVTKQFVEIAINITSLVDSSLGTNTCTGLFYKTILTRTKASTSSSAVLKDVVMPIQLKLNLGKADIVYATPICAGGGVYPATNNGPSSTDGGTFAIDPTASGISINSTTGTITAGSSAVGTYNVFYTYSPRTGCTQHDTFTFQVNHHISGNLFNDGNGIFGDNTVNGTGFNTPDGNQLYAVLLNSADEVVESVAIATDGSYAFNCGPNGTYSILIKTSQPTVGSTGNSSDLPSNWVFTGEKLGTGTGSDGTPDGELTGIAVSGADVANANFGINKRPEAISYSHNIIKPTDGQVIIAGSDASVISSSNLRGEDNEDGTPFTLSTIQITSLPSNDSNEVWYNGSQITKGDDGINPPSTSNPLTINSFSNSLLTFKIYCCEEATLYYSVVDAANLNDVSPAFYRYAWAGAVPVEFTRIGATVDDMNHVNVKWTTATEINNERFEIERLSEGSDEFVKVGVVAGAGNATHTIDYEFTDKTNKSIGGTLYRVKQIDYDGQYDYSNVDKVSTKFELDVNVYPNPANEFFVVQAGNPFEELTIELMDVRGAVLETWSGLSKCRASTAGLLPGVYSLRITGDYSVKTVLLQVQ